MAARQGQFQRAVRPGPSRGLLGNVVPPSGGAPGEGRGGKMSPVAFFSPVLPLRRGMTLQRVSLIPVTCHAGADTGSPWQAAAGNAPAGPVGWAGVRETAGGSPAKPFKWLCHTRSPPWGHKKGRCLAAVPQTSVEPRLFTPVFFCFGPVLSSAQCQSTKTCKSSPGPQRFLENL